MAVTALALASGCSSLPEIDETRTVDLETNLTGYSRLEVDVDGDPEQRPGAMATKGVHAAMEVCGPFYWACSVVTLPVGAATGAIITAVETLPEDQANALNHVTRKVASQLSLDADFQKAMHDEAGRHGIQLRSWRAHVELRVYVTEMYWNVGVGNNVAFEVHFAIEGRSGGQSGHARYKYVSDSAKVHDWVAGTGEMIEQALIRMVGESSVEIWQKILDYDDDDEA
jgi:hypothetical protein